MTENKGKVVSINGNLVSVEFDGNVSMNEICYVFVGDTALKSEVIRIKGNIAQVQVYEMTDGIKCGDTVGFFLWSFAIQRCIYWLSTLSSCRQYTPHRA